MQRPRLGETVALAIDVSARVDDGQLAAAHQLAQDALRRVSAEDGEPETASAFCTTPPPPAPSPCPPPSTEPGWRPRQRPRGALRLAEALVPDTGGRIVLSARVLAPGGAPRHRGQSVRLLQVGHLLSPLGFACPPGAGRSFALVEGQRALGLGRARAPDHRRCPRWPRS